MPDQFVQVLFTFEYLFNGAVFLIICMTNDVSMAVSNSQRWHWPHRHNVLSQVAFQKVISLGKKIYLLFWSAQMTDEIHLK